MKILCMLENLGQGGAERQMIGLASMLAGDGNDVKIIIYDQDFFYLPLLKKTGVECEYLYKAKNKLRRIPVITNYIKEHSPDVVVAFLRTPSIVACCAKIIVGGFKLIVSERNTTQHIGMIDRIHFHLCECADAIVPNSFSQGAFIHRFYPKLYEKTTVITNFTDTDYFRPAGIHIGGSNGFVIRMSCVGRICEQKNVKRFVTAVRKVLNQGVKIKVDWYGMAFPPYSDECAEMVKELNMAGIIEFHRETGDVRSVYQSSDVFMLPGIYEGFPNVVCEAMACGLPVLCSDVCDNGRIVRSGENGFLFNPLSEDDIAEAIVRFSKLTAGERAAMGERSREYAVADFSKQTFFEKYKKLIYG